MAEPLTIGNDDDGRRLDRILRRYLKDLPLSAIHRMLRTGLVTLDGKRAKADTRVTAGALLHLPDLEGLFPDRKAQDSTLPRGLPPLEIIHEDKDILVVNKPEGTLTHGPDSLDDQIQAHLAGKRSASLSFKPGPLHRLDRQTSGLVAFSASLEGARRFSAALQERSIGKHYLAILDGKITARELWTDDLIRDGDERKSRVSDGETDGGVHAETTICPLAWTDTHTLGMLTLGTGRTHQIRIQASSHGHPLSGDRKYGGSDFKGPYLLHAWILEIPGEADLSLPEILVAPIPPRFITAIARFFSREVADKLEKSAPPDLLAGAIL